MPKGKSTKKVRARKVRSTGVWIAPDLERKIKGEGGRRGLSEPPYSYYLHLADLALKTPPPPLHSAGRTSKEHRESGSQEGWPGGPGGHITAERDNFPSSSGDWIPAPQLPVHAPPKAPKLALPKPPKTALTPKPAKRAAVNPLRRPSPKKMRLPKPPKRST